MRIAMIDNYDSFTYNLVHLVRELGADITVFRKPFGVFLLWAGANMLLQKKK